MCIRDRNTQLIKEEKLKNIEERIYDIWEEAKICGITSEELKEMVELICGEE